MNYIKITEHDIANGCGIRVVLWVSGCKMQCKNCHNPQTWNFTAGYPFTRATLFKLFKSIDKPYISGLTLSGGHPLERENRVEVASIVQSTKKLFQDKTIWLYTGYVFEDIIKDDFLKTQILPYIDVLVDGKYEEDKRDISLPWCGSSNQRIIDVHNSLKERKTILWKKDKS